MIPAIHTPPGQINNHIGALELRHPIPQRTAIPRNHPPGRRRRTARQHNHLMTIAVKGPRKHSPHLPAASGQYYFHLTLAHLFAPTTIGGA